MSDAVKLCSGCSRRQPEKWEYPFASCDFDCPLAARSRRHHEAKLTPEEKLRAALNRYGRHLAGCTRDPMKVFRIAQEGGSLHDLPDCTCGFDDVRKQP